jgi:hypothetical protein
MNEHAIPSSRNGEIASHRFLVGFEFFLGREIPTGSGQTVYDLVNKSRVESVESRTSLVVESSYLPHYQIRSATYSTCSQSDQLTQPDAVADAYSREQ